VFTQNPKNRQSRPIRNDRQPNRPTEQRGIADVIRATLAAVGITEENQRRSSVPARQTPVPRAPDVWQPEFVKHLLVHYADASLCNTLFASKFVGMARLTSGRMAAKYVVIGRPMIAAFIRVDPHTGQPIVAHAEGGVDKAAFRIQI